MAKTAPRKIAFIASYFPKKCGIATFTSDLINNISLAADDEFEPLVVAMHSDEDCQYKDPVKFEIRRNVKNDYISAADYLNFSHVDIVSIQHEFGIFGGSAGAYLNLLMSRVNAPIVTTMHTVLDDPPEDYFQSTIDLCRLSDKIIVMNERGVVMLRDIYNVDTGKVELVPHGIPDLSFVDSSYYKHKFGMEDRKTILTFGLLSKNKGIEMMLHALPEIIRADPSVLYIILGATHPSVVKHDGEAYRFSLQRIVKALGLEKHVYFHNRYVTDEKLHNFLCAADIYVTPYRNREQLTSGTLAFAVGTGKAVVSTPYWAAEELLADGRGKIVQFNDSPGLAKAVIEIIKDDRLFYGLRRKAFDYGRKITWPVIGKKYWKLFRKIQPSTPAVSDSAEFEQESMSLLEVPEPPLEHLIRLTDDTGLYQHAKYIIPDRDHGYCTDDNARAVVAMIKYYNQYYDKDSLRLFDIYLSFIHNAQQQDGSVKNFMHYNRRWFEEEPQHDALGRTLWAFGTVIARPPLQNYIPIIKDCFDRSVSHVPSLSPRGKAYSIFGMADYLQQFPGASDIKRYFSNAADDLLNLYSTNSKPDWRWFENIITYDNAVLPHALYTAYLTTSEDKYLKTAEESCRFLLENTYCQDRFSFIGCEGWFPKDKKRASFDQQPLEVVSTVMMLRAAYDATGNMEYLKLQRKAFDWFLGVNDLQIPVYDFRTKGCGDGLQSTAVNLNQGAESMLSFILSLLCVVESFTIAGQNPEKKTLQIENTEHKSVKECIEDIKRIKDSVRTLAREIPERNN